MASALTFVAVSVPSDNYVCYEKSEVLLVLNTRDIPLSLKDLNFEAETALIYSEDVILEGNITLPGKNIGIFCANLVVASEKANIDVSGKPGESGNQTTKGVGPSGKVGDDGGKVWLYVENMQEEIMSRVRIAATGGDGGQGSDTTDNGKDALKAPSGGSGGDGGKGGEISVFYGSKAFSLLIAVVRSRSLAWPEKVILAQEKFIPVLVELKESFSSFSHNITEDFKQTLSTYETYARSTYELFLALGCLCAARTKSQVQPRTVEITQSCRDTIAALRKSQDAPPTLEKTSNANLKLLTERIYQWLRDKDDGKQSEEGLCSDIESLTSAINVAQTTSSESDLMESFSGVETELIALEYRIKGDTKTQMCRVSGGKGGSGGSSASAETPPGLRGTNGDDGVRTSKNLAFDGRSSDLVVSQVCAFPEECQMLLNKADRYFFTNNLENYQLAATLYSRLTKRLAFVPTMLNSQSDSPMRKAYEGIEEVQKLTVSAMAQLESILSQATSRLNKISLGQDMFGHSISWAPRLSPNFYKSRVNILLNTLKIVEDTIDKHQKAIQEGNKTGDYIQAGMQANRNSKTQADNRISLLLGDTGHGELTASATKIRLFTPILARKRGEIRTGVEEIVEQIRNKINLDPREIVDALSTLVTSQGSGAVKLAQTGYKSLTTITDAQGAKINKENVILDLRSCSGTLESLDTAYHTVQDGTMIVDNPGSLKIVASADSIRSLVEEFKSAIPVSHSKNLNKQLDDYISTIEKRNQAVLDYNASLTLLRESIAASCYYEKQNQSLGQNALKLDSTLPFVYFWLKKMMNDLQIDIMQQLNNESRAICFWGLHAPFPFSEPGPLRGHVDLALNQSKLDEEFARCVELFASTVWSVWPSNKNELGLLYKFTENQLLELLSPTVSDGKKTYRAVIPFTQGMPMFGGMYNIRLSQVRVWLLGAKVAPDPQGRQPLAINVKHLGYDSLQSSHRRITNFSHESVSLQSRYNTADITGIKQCTPKISSSKQALQEDYTGGDVKDNVSAPIGPFTDWVVEVNDADNGGLDLQGITAAYIEFCGRHMPAA